MNLDPNDTNQQQSGDSPSDQDALDAVYAEAFAEEGDAPAIPAAAEPGSDTEQDAAAETPPADPAPGDVAGNQPDAASDAPPAGQSQDDIWANAPDELREAHEVALRDSDLRFRSAASRQSAADRQINELRSEIERLKAGSANSQGAQTSDGDSSGNEGDDTSTDRQGILEGLREEYPELAGPLLEEIADMREQMAKLTKSSATFEQQQAEQFVSEQEGLLADTHPDWVDVVQDNRFAGWLQGQTTAIQEAFKRNEAVIVDGKDAAFVLTQFKGDLGIGTEPAQQQQSAAAQAQDAKRKGQLAGNRDARTNSPPVKSGTDRDDYGGTYDVVFADDD